MVVPHLVNLKSLREGSTAEIQMDARNPVFFGRTLLFMWSFGVDIVGVHV